MNRRTLPKLDCVQLVCLLALLVQAACTRAPAQPGPLEALPTDGTHGSTHPPAVLGERDAVKFPPAFASWQIQYTGEIERIPGLDVINLDLFETPASLVDYLHQDGTYVICYFSAGSYENWRPDAANFQAELLGKNLAGWPGEKWLDISRVNLLAPIMEARLDLAVRKGCDGVDPDNVNGYENDTGFALSYQDQLAFNIFLANAAHLRGLAIGLKNDLAQAGELLPYFDWMLNEECFSFDECELLTPFVQAGKPVFVIEYELSPGEFCQRANEIGFNALHKHWELDAYVFDCHSYAAAD